MNFDNGIAKNVEIYGMNGRLIQSHQPTTSLLTIDVSTLENGVYLIHITADSGQRTIKKFVKR